MHESLVRACCVRYALALNGPAAAGQEVKYNRDRRFLWTGELADLLGEYEKQQDVYRFLGAFFPKIVPFIFLFTDSCILLNIQNLAKNIPLIRN